MKVASLHLPPCLSSPSDPACAGLCACGGGGGGGASLKEEDLSQRLVHLVADSLKAYCSQDAHAHVCHGACGGYAPLRALWFYSQ